MRQLSDISFRFAERSKVRSYVTTLSGAMQHPYEREDILTSAYLLGDFDEALMAKSLQLLDPSRGSIGVTCKELPKDVTASFDKKEAIYGTHYHQEKLPEEFLKDMYSGPAIPEIFLPGPNPFVPQRLDVDKFAVDKPAERPELLVDNEISRLWYKRDDRFWLPKTNVYIEVQSPLLEATPRTAVLGRLMCELFYDSVTEDIYDAELAELNFALWYGGNSFNLAVTGFSDKQSVLLEAMLKKLIEFEVDPERFDKIVDRVRLRWKNFELSEPYHVIGFWQSYVTTQVIWTQKERLAEIDREFAQGPLHSPLTLQTLRPPTSRPTAASFSSASTLRRLSTVTPRPRVPRPSSRRSSACSTPARLPLPRRFPLVFSFFLRVS